MENEQERVAQPEQEPELNVKPAFTFIDGQAQEPTQRYQWLRDHTAEEITRIGVSAFAKALNEAGQLPATLQTVTPEVTISDDRIRARYEFIRAATPRSFSEIWHKNILGGRMFDDLVDEAIAERGAK